MSRDDYYSVDVKLASSNGKTILIDAEDLELVSQHAWTVTVDGYAKKYYEKMRSGVRVRWVVHMHRLVMDAKEGQIVDHINQNKLDNRKSNLRFVNRSLNALNSSKTKSSTGYRGVCRNTQKGKAYKATITLNGKRIHLGMYNTPLEAHAAYLTKQKELTR